MTNPLQIVVGGIIGIYMIKVPIKEPPSIKRVDFLGAITLVATLVLLLLGMVTKHTYPCRSYSDL